MIRENGMNRKDRKAIRKQMARNNKKRPKELTQIPREAWPKDQCDVKRVSVWISQKYFVQCFLEEGNTVRISVNRTMVKYGSLYWEENLTWDELQDIKRQVGFGDRCAVEVYPQDEDLVNVANMRHLWVLPEGQKVGWFKK